MNQSPENKKSKEEYLEDLLTHIESEFGGLAIKYHGLHNNTSEARLDEIYAHVLGGKYAQAESLDLDAVLAQQAQAQSHHADEDGDTTVLDGLIASTKAELDEITAELDKYTKKPQQYLIEAENLITYTQELLSEHEVHMKNLRRTYTREEVLATIPYLTVYGETLPKGGKAPNVEIIPSVMTDLELEEFLSADAKEFRTYKPLKIKAEQSTFIVGNEADNFSVVPLTKRESAALKDDPNIMQLFPVASLRDTLMDLSESLKVLQSLYF